MSETHLNLSRLESEGKDDEDYWLSLASLPLSELKNEPNRIKNQIQVIDGVLNDLSLDHYGVFIVNRECVRYIKSEACEISEHIAKLAQGLEGISINISSFHDEASELLANYRRNNETLRHYSNLSELLRVPQLLDTCARNVVISDDIFEHVISISNFIFERTFNSLNKDTPRVAQLLSKEVRKSLEKLEHRMLLQLRENLSLASCLQVISRLRRIGGLLSLKKSAYLELQATKSISSSYRSKPEDIDVSKSRSLILLDLKLQAAFLEAKDASIENMISNLHHSKPIYEQNSQSGMVADVDAAMKKSGATPYQFLVDMIEGSRTSWFEIATQFHAIFGNSGEQALFSWFQNRIYSFVQLVTATLPHITDTASLRSILEQSMSFGASMGRLGADFRYLLEPIFNNAIYSLISKQWDATTLAFESGILSLKTSSSVSTALPLCSSTESIYEKFEPVIEPDRLVSPPLQLLSYPLFAHYLNGILVGLNQLRECNSISLETLMKHSVTSSMNRVCKVLSEHRDSYENSINQVHAALKNLLIPYMSCAFCHIFSDIGTQQFNQFEKELTTELLKCCKKYSLNGNVNDEKTEASIETTEKTETASAMIGV